MIITRRFEFDAGHRVLGHTGKCRHLHGHRYAAEVTVQANEVNELGMVMDFSDIKVLVGNWIDSNWDHNMILNSDDPVLLYLCKDEANERKPYILTKTNPTAENMAEHLWEAVHMLLKGYNKKNPGYYVGVVRVRLYETPNSWADADHRH